jgi:hypothetical protein
VYLRATLFIPAADWGGRCTTLRQERLGTLDLSSIITPKKKLTVEHNSALSNSVIFALLRSELEYTNVL